MTSLWKTVTDNDLVRWGSLQIVKKDIYEFRKLMIFCFFLKMGLMNSRAALILFLCVFVVLVMEPMASCMKDKCSTIELHPQLTALNFKCVIQAEELELPPCHTSLFCFLGSLTILFAQQNSKKHLWCLILTAKLLNGTSQETKNKLPDSGLLMPI